VLENVARFRFLEKMLTNQNSMHKEIKSRSISRMSDIIPSESLPSPLMSKNTKMKVHKTTPVVDNGCETL
jgi:hypothetical protein